MTDIKAMSYTSMPATLAKPVVTPVPPMPLLPMARVPMVGGVVMPAGTQPPPMQQMRIPPSKWGDNRDGVGIIVTT